MSQSPLKNLSIASPCSADWNQMLGNEQVRFCQQCQLNVYNVSAMAQSEAEALIQNTEGRLCVRFYRRSDGTVLTQDYPIRLQRLHWHKTKRLRHLAAAVSLVTILGTFTVGAELAHETDNMVMGDVAVPSKIKFKKIKSTFVKPHKACDKKQPKNPQTEPQVQPPVMGKMSIPQNGAPKE